MLMAPRLDLRDDTDRILVVRFTTEPTGLLEGH